MKVNIHLMWKLMNGLFLCESVLNRTAHVIGTKQVRKLDWMTWRRHRSASDVSTDLRKLLFWRELDVWWRQSKSRKTLKERKGPNMLKLIKESTVRPDLSTWEAYLCFENQVKMHTYSSLTLRIGLGSNMATCDVTLKQSQTTVVAWSTCDSSRQLHSAHASFASRCSLPLKTFSRRSETGSEKQSSLTLFAVWRTQTAVRSVVHISV